MWLGGAVIAVGDVAQALSVCVFLVAGLRRCRWVRVFDLELRCGGAVGLMDIFPFDDLELKPEFGHGREKNKKK